MKRIFLIRFWTGAQHLIQAKYEGVKAADIRDDWLDYWSRVSPLGEIDWKAIQGFMDHLFKVKGFTVPSNFGITEITAIEIPKPDQVHKKCIVKDCENHEDQGNFVGDLCAPCHIYITTGDHQGQAYANALKTAMEALKEHIKEDD